MISLTPPRQIIDGGSTGSRLHILEVVEAVDGEEFTAARMCPTRFGASQLSAISFWS
jgi:hypothetical protein